MSRTGIAGLAVLALAALVVVALVVVDGVARSAMESSLTEAFGTESSVESVDVGVFSGEVTAEGIVVSNPEAGWESPRFAALARMRASAGLLDLLGDTVTVRRVELEEMELHLERRGAGANFVPVLGSVSELRAAAGADRRRYRVEELVVRSAVARVRLEDGGREETVEVPEIRLTDVGGEGGRTMGQIAGAVLEAALRGALSRSVGLPGGVSGLLRGELGGLGDLPGRLDLGPAGGDGEEDAADRVRDAVEEVLPGGG
jgi:hypothetical protein